MLKKDAFHVDLKSATLISGNSEKFLDLKDYILSISVVEDIFSPYVHCELNIFDYNYITTKFPLIGEEYFSLVFSSDGQEETKYDFLIYRNSLGGFNDTNKMQYYTLYGTTLPYAIDGAIRVSKSFNNQSYAEIVSNLFNDYFKKTIKVEPTKGVQRFIAPGVSPFTAIDLCKKRSISVKEPYTPYVFFENQKGYNYVSVNALFNTSIRSPSSKILHYYVNTLNAGDDQERSLSPMSLNVVGPNALNDVLTFDIIDKYNTVDKMRNNVFYSSARFFDITTKSFSVKEFDLNKKKETFLLGNGGEFNTPRFVQALSKGFSASGPFTVVSTARAFDQSSVDFYPEAMASMNAYKELMLQERVSINIYGDSTMKAGDSFKFGAVLPTGKLDPTVSGNYLIISLKHIITIDSQPRHITAIECIRGNYIDDIGDISAR